MKSLTIGTGAGLAFVLAATSATADHSFMFRLEHMGGLARNYLLTLNPPAGTLSVETNPDAAGASDNAAAAPTETAGDCSTKASITRTGLSSPT